MLGRDEDGRDEDGLAPTKLSEIFRLFMIGIPLVDRTPDLPGVMGGNRA